MKLVLTRDDVFAGHGDEIKFERRGYANYYKSPPDIDSVEEALKIEVKINERASWKQLGKLLKRKRFFPKTPGNNAVWVLRGEDSYPQRLAYYVKLNQCVEIFTGRMVGDTGLGVLCSADGVPMVPVPEKKAQERLHFFYYSSPLVWGEEIFVDTSGQRGYRDLCDCPMAKNYQLCGVTEETEQAWRRKYNFEER